MKSSKQKSSNRVQECFVLVYDALEDPSTEQTAEALDQLSSFETEEVVPGTIRVVGPRVDIRAGGRRPEIQELEFVRRKAAFIRAAIQISD